jgi:uncharacterized protein YqgQ
MEAASKRIHKTTYLHHISISSAWREEAIHDELKTMYRSCLLLKSLEYAATIRLIKIQERKEVNIRSVERGTRFCRHVRNQ